MYIDFTTLEATRLHAMFQDHRTSSTETEDFGSLTICWHGGHFGYVTWPIDTNVYFPTLGGPTNNLAVMLNSWDFCL